MHCITRTFAPVVVGLALASGVCAQSSITALAPVQGGYVFASQWGLFYQPNTGERVSLTTTLDHVHALRFSPDRKTLAVIGGFPAEKGAAELWAWPTKKRFATIEGHSDVMYDAVWLDDKRLTTASADRIVRIWNVATRKTILTLKGHSGPVLSLAATADGQWLCSASADHTIRVWKTATGKLVRALTNHLGPVQHIAFRPNRLKGRPPYLASASSDRTIRIWQPTIGRMVRIIRHPAQIKAVTWNRDGAKLFSGSRDGVVRIIDGDSDEILAQHQASRSRIQCLAMSGAEALLIADGKGRIHKLPIK